MDNPFYLPYLINYAQLKIDDIAIFIVAMLMAVLVNAEGQGFAATVLGNNRFKDGSRFNFNVFLHMSPLGTLSFFVAGFGWTKMVDIDVSQFKSYPSLKLYLARMAGPVCNLMMANIAASINWIFSKWAFENKVFEMLVVVNVTMAIYNLLPIPPLPGGALIQGLLLEKEEGEKLWKRLCLGGSILLIAGFLVIRLLDWQGIGAVLNPVVLGITHFILGG